MLLQRLSYILISALALTGCSSNQPLETVDSVDLQRYQGTWFEIASFPQRFQKGCHCTSATYTATQEDFVVVENRCRKDSINGEESYIKGKAYIVENTNNAKLEVEFFWPFKGDYWIIDLDKDYQYAVVGHPNREYLWILSRTPQMSDSLYNEITKRIAAKGFDLSILQKTVQIAP
jgi:apolipoprotein D and lipocalin family protein